MEIRSLFSEYVIEKMDNPTSRITPKLYQYLLYIVDQIKKTEKCPEPFEDKKEETILYPYKTKPDACKSHSSNE